MSKLIEGYILKATDARLKHAANAASRYSTEWYNTVDKWFAATDLMLSKQSAVIPHPKGVKIGTSDEEAPDYNPKYAGLILPNSNTYDDDVRRVAA